MKKSSPFVAIPTIPTTLSGQWLTFSHMANHYRKLLNVKPRVQSNAPRPSSISALQASAPKIKKSKSGSKPGVTKKENTLPYPKQTGKNRESSKTFQLVFGQSELNNLSEAVMSDSEVEGEELNGHPPMGISEKINLYLDQLEEAAAVSEENESRCSVSPYRIPSVSASRATRLARHSQCFIPYNGSPKRKTTSKGHSNLAPQLRPKATLGLASPAQKNKKIKMPEVPTLLLAPTKIPGSPVKKTLKKLKPSTSKKAVSGQRKCFSPISIGTVRGSDDMAEGRFLSLVSESEGIKSSPTRGHGHTKVSSEWLRHERSRGGSNSANKHEIHPSTSNSTGLVNNKDSSRDSAYGFSSGESKITTRESTPEKRKGRNKRSSVDAREPKYKSNLSTVASSINQESGADSFNYEPKPGIPLGTSQLSSSQDWATDEKYIAFITAVTDDIIKREIFTNKGLKTLFQSHIDSNPNLDMEKMVHMLDRLRMDVGVPKDDSLNQIEFGYGSIKYSTGPYFRRLGQLALDFKLTTESVETQSHKQNGRAEGSELSLVDLHHRLDLNSGDESSKMSSNSVTSLFDGDISQPPGQRAKESISPSSKSSDVSISESEIQRALGEVGFDLEATKEIVSIVKSNTKRLQAESPTILEPNNNKPFNSDPQKITSHGSIEST